MRAAPAAESRFAYHGSAAREGERDGQGFKVQLPSPCIKILRLLRGRCWGGTSHTSHPSGGILENRQAYRHLPLCASQNQNKEPMGINISQPCLPRPPAKSAVSIRPNQRCLCRNHASLLLPGNPMNLVDQAPPQLLQRLPRYTAVVDEIALDGPVRVADHGQGAQHALRSVCVSTWHPQQRTLGRGGEHGSWRWGLTKQSPSSRPWRGRRPGAVRLLASSRWRA